MASAREERMQQRLRGAQRRQVKDVNFDLIFTAGPSDTAVPAPPQSITQPLVSTQVSDKTTPIGRDRPPSTIIQSSARRSADANISAKRRKLDTDETPLSSARSTRSQVAFAKDIYDIPIDELPQVQAVATSDESIERSHQTQVEKGQTAALPTNNALPNSSVHDGAKLAQTEFDARPESPATDSSIIELAEKQDQSTAQGSKWTRSQAARKSPDSAQAKKRTSEVDNFNELSAKQQKRKGRKSDAKQAEPVLSEEPVEELAESIDDEEAAVVLRKNPQRKVRTPQAEQEVLQPRTKKSRPLVSPVLQRQSRKALSKAKARIANKTRARGSKETISVPVHRLTKGSTYDEKEEDAYVLNASVACAKRSGVNAIDVLNQVCHEMVESALDTLQEGRENADDIASRREYTVKLRVVEAFGRELSLRLLEHTINLDNTHSLQRRLSEEQRKKLALREDILRVRAEREQIALQMDNIRIKHENEMQDAEGRNILNNMAHDIELAAERGKESRSGNDGLTGFDVVVKRLADQIGVKGPSGGVLQRIKDFNDFMDRAALALEESRHG